MSYEFVIKKRPKDSEAIIFSGKHEIAKIKNMKALVLSSYDTKTSKSGCSVIS
jgi:hypothetical protein